MKIKVKRMDMSVWKVTWLVKSILFTLFYWDMAKMLPIWGKTLNEKSIRNNNGYNYTIMI